VVALGLLAGIYYVLDTLSNQQTDLVLAALLVGGCLLLVRGRDVWAGVSFGVAAGMKCTPLLWAPYLAWRRRWWAAGMVIVVAVGINLLPDLTHPPPEGKSRLSQWVAVYLRPLAGADRDPGVWGSAINFNHSVAGVCNRWLTYERVPQGGDLVPAPRPDRISAVVLKVIVYSACLLFALAAILAAQRRTGVSAPPVGRTLLSGEAGEFGLVLILMLLLSPMSSKPHFCTLLLPGFFLARAAVERRDLLPRCLLAAAIVAGLLSNKDLVSRLVYDATVWYGSVFWNAVLLFAGCVAVLLRRSEAAALPKRLPLAAYASTPSAAPHPG
jgi:hypothetical protein